MESDLSFICKPSQAEFFLLPVSWGLSPMKTMGDICQMVIRAQNVEDIVFKLSLFIYLNNISMLCCKLCAATQYYVKNVTLNLFYGLRGQGKPKLW